MTTPTVDRQVERRLAETDVRYTRGRRVVIRALAEADGPRSAAELSQVIGESVPLSSLYRSLAVLEEAGVLAPHFSSPGLTRYELAEWLRGHHHHLVCVCCGRVQDIEVSEAVERRLRDLITDIADDASFAELNHVLEIEGHCAQCA
jgi:Fur family ferric uptake transcriptional regulator